MAATPVWPWLRDRKTRQLLAPEHKRWMASGIASLPEEGWRLGPGAAAYQCSAWRAMVPMWRSSTCPRGEGSCCTVATALSRPQVAWSLADSSSLLRARAPCYPRVKALRKEMQWLETAAWHPGSGFAPRSQLVLCVCCCGTWEQKQAAPKLEQHQPVSPALCPESPLELWTAAAAVAAARQVAAPAYATSAAARPLAERCSLQHRHTSRSQAPSALMNWPAQEPPAQQLHLARQLVVILLA
mmetsp:Transcript_28390/g.65830  ORF Transcript_28390/g.65830 Transcript_28390/m.65830 type:complete len:242 (+) Transcript_28390:918-1643(+)